jgi:hypothetical protein
VCERLSQHLDSRMLALYAPASNDAESGAAATRPTRPTLTDVQRVVRDACRDAGFIRRGIEACHHIVRRNSNRIVHAAFDLHFNAQLRQTAPLWRNPVLAPAEPNKVALATQLCTSGLSYTTCPPAAVDVFILPDEELWILSDLEQLEQLRRREAMRRGPTDTVPDRMSDAAASAAVAAAAAAPEQPKVPLVTPKAPRPRPRWAEHHEYATAVDEAVDFDDDDTDDWAHEHHEEDPEMERIFKEAAARNLLQHHDEL